jgi:hypothetical protein
LSDAEKGHNHVRIEPFQLERWMTTYEMDVQWDIAESGDSCHQDKARGSPLVH